VAQYSIESGEDKPVTAARKFIYSSGGYFTTSATTLNGMNTTDRYFWAEKGLFGAQYVEEIIFVS